MRGIKERIWNGMPNVKLPTLGTTVDIPIYVIHNSPDAEDYFFIFDFEQFVERSKGGIFVRPKLKVWAGRSDFARRKFARQFRESFSVEFEAARHAMAESRKPGAGWLGVGFGLEMLGSTIPGFLALLVLGAAFSVGNVIWSALPDRPRLRRKPSDEEKLEHSIEETKGKVDQALEAMQVTVHRDLRKHAFREAATRRMEVSDDDAWPLPAFVLQYLTGQPVQKSTSWW